jgi:hypothetical protein
MAKPRSMVRTGVRMTKDGPRIVTTKKGKGIVDKILKKAGK